MRPYCSLEELVVNQDYLSMLWECQHCNLNFYLTALGRLRHQVQCQKEKQESLGKWSMRLCVIRQGRW